MNLETLNLDLSAEGFSLSNARALLSRAQRAYEEFTFRDGSTGTDVLVEYLPDALIVAFRGTSEIKDWIVDAEFSRTYLDCTRGEVHLGFYRAWLGVREQLASLLGDSRPIFFTGHSLGGALAQIAAEWFTRNGGLVSGVYTFGSPRLWDRGAADSYNSVLRDATFNLVNACDPVPLLPPLLTGYRDAGTEIFLPADVGVQASMSRQSAATAEACPFSTYLTDPFIGWELLDDLLGAIRSWRQARLAFLPNHFLARYAEKISLLSETTLTPALSHRMGEGETLPAFSVNLATSQSASSAQAVRIDQPAFNCCSLSRRTGEGQGEGTSEKRS